MDKKIIKPGLILLMMGMTGFTYSQCKQLAEAAIARGNEILKQS
jgi:hypothetical protein